MTGRLSRRRLLKNAAVAGVSAMVIPEGLAFGSRANEQVRIAQIGCGGRGGWFVNAIPQIGERHVAMCDVDQERAAESYKKLPDVPKFTDYRKMLEEKDKEIDAVIVAADFKKPEPFLPRHGSHEREWIGACQGGPKAMSNFDYGAVLTEFVLLGNVATQFDRELVYDPLAMEFVGDDEAPVALRREHREGWADRAGDYPLTAVFDGKSSFRIAE